MATVAVAGVLLWLWWLLFSRAPRRWRLVGAGAVALGVAAVFAGFRIRGVSGDLVPILEPRWSRESRRAEGAGNFSGATRDATRERGGRADFPQFLGPTRNATLHGLALERDWAKRPPQVLWRQPIGAGWSGFAVVGARAVTQEQAGDDELVSCYAVEDGRRLWSHVNRARYATTIAGVGPRCTPTVVSNRVFALGATGILNCLDLASGRPLWTRRLTDDGGVAVPEWGFAGSPLYFDEKVIVSAGGDDGRSLIAYHAATGEIAWTGGSAPASYSSPCVATLAGVPQILMFNAKRITSHAPADGRVLWEYPWGIGQPHVAVPVVVASNRVVFSSGYGVGAALLQVNGLDGGKLGVERVWKSPRLKAKFANFVQRDGFLYGLDDGVLACVAVADGSQRWREGRYGHGQVLLVDDLLLVTAENGELILLAPTPEVPNELGRFRVFASKTWNPPALSGELLLVRNDLEAACVRLALAQP
ncbi:MAG: PQQ-like beta-propeller repeat protein [Bryobacteraceae bacterium]|nr:PQQ-like beta-propeller repeat protein [Bryobacteraceae bacterium]